MFDCPLCQKKNVIPHKKSHLVPEWMYKDYYDNNHKLVSIEFEKKFVGERQKGIYSTDIICVECEKESQVYDRYASLILTERAMETPEYRSVEKRHFGNETKNNKYNYSSWSNLDFGKFQRFVFAVVLRTHLAKKKENKYLLIDRHFDKMRTIYEDNKIQDDHSYPITVVKLHDDDKFKDQVIIPFIDKKEGHHLIEFAGAGYSFLIFVSNHSKPPYVSNASLKKSGSVVMLHMYFEERGTFKTINKNLNEWLARSLKT